jgi:F-type H+-transporting ATPase subunit a
MAANPFEHVLDRNGFPLFETLGWEIHLPKIAGFQITKYMVLEVIAAALIVVIFVPLARRVSDGSLPRGPFWNAFESLLTFIRDIVAKPYLGHDTDRFLPFLWTMFLFILFCNLLGLFPFLGSPTASLAVTGALALCSFLVIHGSAVVKLGPGGYIKSYIPHVDAPGPLKLLLVGMIMGIEILGQFIKAFVLAVRLFANMFGGHTVLSVILLFILMAKNAGPILFPSITAVSVLGVTALSLLELFVAFLQAFIFTFLTSLFLGMALHPHH